MELSETCYKYITIDENGVPIIEGTRTKVIELVIERIAYGWSPEELYFQHNYLTLGQIYSALAYYEDNKEELDQDIQNRLNKIENLRQHTSNSPLLKQLRLRKYSNEN